MRGTRFPFADASSAFETAKNGVGPDGKMAIKAMSKSPQDKHGNDLPTNTTKQSAVPLSENAQESIIKELAPKTPSTTEFVTDTGECR